jgi:hypothetical protein
MAAAAIAIWLRGAEAPSQAVQGGPAAASSAVVSASASAAAAVLPALASIRSAVFSPVAEVLHHMFMGWQHCWVVIAAHPSMAGLQQLSELLSRVGAVVPWQIVAAITAVAATAISIRRQMAKEKASIRWAAVWCMVGV